MKVLVVDDEPLARRRLLRMLDTLPEVAHTAEAADGVEALQRVAEADFDVVLLDIRMPGLDGLATAKRLAHRVPVVFATAYDAHALAAFELAAVDYLVKPVRRERLQTALQRVRQQAPDPAAVVAAAEVASHPDRLAVRHRGAVHLFDPAEITRLYATDKLIGFRVEGTEFLLEGTLGALEDRLGPQGFVRVHRSELVNLHHVRALHGTEGALEVELSDGQRARVSRRSAPELRRRLGLSERGLSS